RTVSTPTREPQVASCSAAAARKVSAAPMVDGKPGNETVTGTYEIYLRYEKQDMTNEATYPEGHEKHYYNPDVPWVQYFHRGYGFHGAPWRSSFGYSGSHGCINMPVHEAKRLYDWASMGTRVEVHH